MTYKNWIKVAVLALLGTGLLLPACGSSNNNATPSNGSAGSGGKKDAGSAGKDAGSSGKDAGNAGKDAGTTPKDGGGATGACAKDSAKDCYTCDKPTSDDEFLNHCTSATCTAYDNSKLTTIVNGKLPALP
jgi:hypothetical protein